MIEFSIKTIEAAYKVENGILRRKDLWLRIQIEIWKELSIQTE
jgi:hypothetical protein